MNIPWKTLAGGISMPELGQGTWRLGGVSERDPGNDDARDVAVIRRALDAGLIHIDTAEMYAGGHAEELVGEAIRGVERSRLFLTGKVWKTHLGGDGPLRAAEASLQRLGVDMFDLYLVHQVNPEVPLKETIRAMNRLQRRGLALHIGVSNFSLERLKQAQALSEVPIVANQLHYNLQVREIELSGLLDFCRETGVMVIAWRPLRGVDCAVPLLEELAAKYRRTPRQLALNWLISQPGVVTIVKASDPLHLAENVGAAGWRMAEEDVERLRREFPDCRTVSEAVPLI